MKATSSQVYKKVRCPQCGGDSIFAPVNAFRPFCGQRCKSIDLGAWASENFRVPADMPPNDSVGADTELQ